MLAGSQGGKTEFANHWMYREIKNCGDGDYMVVSPSYPLQQKKVLPTYLDIFDITLRLGDYKVNDRIFYMKNRGFNSKIFFGSADNPDSLESATAKAAHLDEVGQKGFKLNSWEAVLRRVGFHRGRILGTTTIYNRGWMKAQIYDKWREGNKDIDVIQFPSIWNPAYPKESYQDAMDTLPAWKFNMFYKGQYDKPAGMIYDVFDEDECKKKYIELKPEWPRYVGHDFGGVNTIALWLAEHKVNSEITRYYLYREYHEGGKSIREHAENFKRLSQGENIIKAVGGSPSEDQWRRDFTDCGWPIQKPPIKDVEVGINRVYALHKKKSIWVLEDCKGWLDETGSYTRELDDNNEPTEKIEDKELYHMMDATRYIISDIVRDTGKGSTRISEPRDMDDPLATGYDYEV